MKQLAFTFIILSFLAQSFSRIFILADYYANTAAYAKNCINKSRPVMHCNGKCQMMKKIWQQEKKDQEDSERKENLKNEVLFPGSFLAALTAQDIESVAIIKIPAVSICDTIDRCYDIFHPPQS